VSYPRVPIQTEHDAVGVALAEYERALEHYADISQSGAADDELQAAYAECDDLCELLAAAREAHGAATRRLVVEPVKPAPGTEWLRDVTLEW